MTTTIEFYYDIASPNSYMANRALQGIAERHGATIQYIPFLLGGAFKATNNQAPWMMYAEVAPKLKYFQTEMGRFVKKHELSAWKMNPHFPLNTLNLMRGAVAAGEMGQLPEYIAAAESLVWEQGLNMQEPEVFATGFTDMGLDGAALLEKTQDPAVKQALIDNTSGAVERGVFGAPSLFIGDELYFGKDSLHDLEDELIAVAAA